MKKYLLTVFGDFDNDEICKQLAMGISPIVDSPHLKFQKTKSVVIFHFGSEVSQEEIYDFISVYAESFILSEYDDRMSVCFPEEIKEHLFNLESDLEKATINLDLSSMRDEIDDDEIDEDFMASILSELKTNIRKPTLNQLLDKMLEKGMNSLSPYEKKILEEYSKN